MEPTERRKELRPAPGALFFTGLGIGLALVGSLLLFLAFQNALLSEVTLPPPPGSGLAAFLLGAIGGGLIAGGLALLRWPIHEFRPVAWCGCGGELWHGDEFCSRCGEKAVVR